MIYSSVVNTVHENFEYSSKMFVINVLLLLICLRYPANVIGQVSGNATLINEGIAYKFSTKLAPTSKFTYSIIVDKYVVNSRAVRQPAKVTLEVMSADLDGNIEALATLKSDTITVSSSVTMFRTSTPVKLIGARLGLETGRYKAVIDKFGRILSSKKVQNHDDSDGDGWVPGGQITDAQAFAEHAATFPAFFAFATPVMVNDSIITIGTEYYDTSYVVTNHKTIGLTYDNAQASVPVVEFDTLYRSVRVDSIVPGDYGHDVACLTIVARRASPFGGINLITANVRRDLNIGVVTQIIEYVDAVTKKGTQPLTSAIANLERYSLPTNQKIPGNYERSPVNSEAPGSSKP